MTNSQDVGLKDLEMNIVSLCDVESSDQKMSEVLSGDNNENNERNVVEGNTRMLSRKIGQMCSWKTLDFVLNDLLVVFFSLCDIFLDLAVCQQFYAHDQMEFFYISVLIFILAQFSYCFLFVATWGKDLSPSMKMILFIVVLPFGQLIPFFTWVESFRFQWIDDILEDAGLRPTAVGGTARDREREEDEINSGGDMLWGYIQTKYQAHAGFLAEALAEAIPQCILQTIAIISTGEASSLFIVSITISICVISSKGYLVSYSIHRPTFIFNFLCIAADCFGLFSTCAWLFDRNGGIVSIVFSDKFQLPDDNLEAAWLILFGAGCFLLILGGLCLVVFSMLDDHMKTFNENRWGQFDIDNVAFDLYFVRTLAWIVSVIPVCVVFLTSKLTLIPICLFNSLDPEHAQNYTFYSALFKFLKLYKTDMRIAETNKFILECRRKVPELTRTMKHSSIEWDYGRRRTPRARREQELIRLRAWLQDVGKKERNRQRIRNTPTVPENSYTEFHEAVSRALSESYDDTAARAAVRSVNVNFAMLSRFARCKRELSRRSAIFYMLFAEQSNEDDPDLVCTMTVLFYTGMVFMWIGLIATAILIPCFFSATILGVLFPIIQLLRGAASGSDLTIVSVFLTVAYCCLILAMLGLAPFVGEFQLFRTDIVDLTGFPPIFYEIETIKHLHSRFVKEIDDRLLDKTLDSLFGMDVALHIKSYVDYNGSNVNEAIMTTFQNRVQSV